jgi:hypothetical protein
MDQDIDVGSLQVSIGEGVPTGPESQVAVEHPPFGPAPLVCAPELIVQSPFVDTEVPHDPLWLQGFAVRTHRMEVVEDLLVRDPMVG